MGAILHEKYIILTLHPWTATQPVVSAWTSISKTPKVPLSKGQRMPHSVDYRCTSYTHLTPLPLLSREAWVWGDILILIQHLGSDAMTMVLFLK